MSSVMMDRWGLDCAVEFLQHGYNFDYANYSRGDYGHFRDQPSIMRRINQTPSPEENLQAIKKFAYQCWDNFLTAIVLWDEIWSFQTMYDWERIVPNTMMPNIAGIMHQVDSSMLEGYLLYIYIVNFERDQQVAPKRI